VENLKSSEFEKEEVRLMSEKEIIRAPAVAGMFY